ncbi:methyltransferase [Lysobacter sp. CA199]|uniref:methyltransferase n=1 Tax=Lysobacter sp. CA199 TaxID=3455608 RepID=UPI003F8D2C3B
MTNSNTTVLADQHEHPHPHAGRSSSRAGQRDEGRLVRIAASGGFPRALAVAARLGLADLTATQARSPAELAAHTGTDPEALALLLRTLALIEVFNVDADGHFRLGEDFAQLRSDHSQSLRNFCILLAETYDDAFGGLLTTVRTGKSGFQSMFGASLYEYLAGHPEAEAIFDNAMAELARPDAAALAEHYDFAEVASVVDIGGGGGAFLRGILAAHPHLRGICLDRPSVCARAQAAQRADAGDELADRLTFQPADIFREIPEGGDRYLVKNVLYDWSFDNCLRLLVAARTAMLATIDARASGPESSRLLIVEPLFERESDAARALFQMVICEDGTRGFNEAHLRKLTEAAGLKVLSVERLPGGHTVFECAP